MFTITYIGRSGALYSITTPNRDTAFVSASCFRRVFGNVRVWHKGAMVV